MLTRETEIERSEQIKQNKLIVMVSVTIKELSPD